jgi:hypothetical protein
VACTPPTTGTAGFTTRFWDCCKPSCGWTGNTGGNTPVASCNAQDQKLSGYTQASACNSGGSAYACSDLSPWSVDDNTAYAFAAYNGGSCGDCYQLTFTGQSNSTGNDPGSKSLCGKSLIVQVVNIGGIQANQFDIMIPGGGVGANPNACPTEWGTSNIGDTNGGFLLTCQNQNAGNYSAEETCTKNFCSTVFSQSDQAGFLAGCNWQVDWFAIANNPKMMYTKVSCPSAITSKSGLQ